MARSMPWWAALHEELDSTDGVNQPCWGVCNGHGTQGYQQTIELFGVHRRQVAEVDDKTTCVRESFTTWRRLARLTRTTSTARGFSVTKAGCRSRMFRTASSALEAGFIVVPDVRQGRSGSGRARDCTCSPIPEEPPYRRFRRGAVVEHHWLIQCWRGRRWIRRRWFVQCSSLLEP